MGDLKSVLKQAKQLLGAEKSQEAIDLLEEYLDDSEDYMLFCFAGLAYSNLEDVKESKQMFEKAISLDAAKSVAWQGLFKLHETGRISPDDNGIKTCTKIIEISESSEKKSLAESVRRRQWLALGRYDDLLGDMGQNTEFLSSVVDKLIEKLKLSTTEKKLILNAFASLVSTFAENPDLHLKYCRFLKKNCDLAWVSNFDELARNSAVVAATALDLVIELVYRDYFLELKVSEHLAKVINLNTIDDSSLSFQLIKAICADGMSDALDLLETLPLKDQMQWPVVQVVCRLFNETEDWENMRKLSVLICERSEDSTIQMIARYLQLRCFIELDDVKSVESVLKCIDENEISKEFIVPFVRARLLTGQPLNTNMFDKEDLIRSQILSAIHNSQVDDCLVAEATQLVNGDAQLSDMLLVAELLELTSSDNMSLLVKAAKKSPRCSRAFFLLGKSLLKRNPGKARSCIERAVKIQPNNAEYVKALDQVLQTFPNTIEQRISLLKNCSAVQKPLWMRRSLGGLLFASGDLVGAIDELQHVVRNEEEDVVAWASLADAYAQKGHLQSSVKAYERVLEIHPNSDHAVSLIQVLLRLGKVEEAITRCDSWRESSSDKTVSDAVLNTVDVLDIQARLQQLTSVCGEDRRELLRAVFRRLSELTERKPRMSIAYKLAADTLLVVATLKDHVIPTLEIPASWAVTSSIDALQHATRFFSVALELNKMSVHAWSDVGVVLMIRSRTENNIGLAQKALLCLSKALSLAPVTAAPLRSQLWTRMAEAHRLANDSADLQQHCLVRALQLNKSNDEAWGRLAVLYFLFGEMDLAKCAFESALKWNPQNASAWVGYASLADANGDSRDAMDMFRHSLSIKPATIAVAKYCSYLCEWLRESPNNRFDPTLVMFDMKRALNLLDEEKTSSSHSLQIGVLAELMGHYQEAALCIQTSGYSGPHLDRVLLRCGELRSVAGPLAHLHRLCALPTDVLYHEVLERSDLYNDLFAGIAEQKPLEEFKNAYKSNYKKISVPLIVSAICFRKSALSEDVIGVIHEPLPRHELIDFFPTVVPDGVDKGLQYLEQDGEQPFRYRHYFAKPLVDMLEQRRSSLDLESTNVVVEAAS